MGCAWKACRVSLNPSTRRSPTAWAWASRSAARLSKPMVGGCGRPGASRGVLSFSLRSPLTEPPSVIDVAYWPIASIRTHTLNGRYRRHSGHCSALARNGSVANDPTRTSAAKFGATHAAQFPFVDMLECRPRSEGKVHETARIHHAARRYGSDMAARRAGAAGRADAADRRAHESLRERFGSSAPGHGVPGRTGAIGVDRWRQSSDGLPLGKR